MKYTNRILILYKYNLYNHYTSQGQYRILDSWHPCFDMNINWYIQILYNASRMSSNIDDFHTHIIKNNFFNEREKMKLQNIYFDFQRFKRGIHRFVHICRMKYSKKQNEKNINFEDFKYNHIKLFENNCIYRFDFYELYKIVNNSFTYYEDSIPIIIDIKNPYTNSVFSKANIYNIYFYLMQNGRIPMLFHSYVHENLSKRNVELLFDQQLYINCLIRKYNDLPDSNKVTQINGMLKYMSMKKFSSISKPLLVKIFGKICVNYYVFINLVMNSFDLNYATRKYKNRFVLFMNLFYRNNKKYGRKMFKHNMNGEICGSTIYNHLVY